ncbi:hypothetical protein B0O99DRAFT_667549 [Bisporella sp. PMI_857]|nr:hypothetical protein B0O99DRAFT_667549 [Bisporella sp. PMI_857]
MITLQTTFKYGDESGPPVENIDILLEFPVFTSVTSPDETKTVSLVTTGNGSLSFNQVLAASHYYVPLPTSSLFTTDYVQVIAQYFSSLGKQTNWKINLSDISVSLSASYGGRNDNDVTLDAIYFLKLIDYNRLRIPGRNPELNSIISEQTQSSGVSVLTENPFRSTDMPTSVVLGQSDAIARTPRNLVEGTRAIVNRDSKDEQQQLIDSNIYIVNKKTYLEYLTKFFPSVPESSKCILLYVLNILVDLTGKSPTLSQTPASTLRTEVTSLLEKFGLAQPTGFFETMSKYLPVFFDFPLNMPVLRPLTIAGNLKVDGHGVAIPTKINLDFYKLSAEFMVSTSVANKQIVPVLNISRFPWDSSTVRFERRLQFAFKDRYMLNQISGPVTIRVKAFDGSDVYAANFTAEDPVLQRLDITVDLRAPSTINGGSCPPGQNTSKKLRGKVVSLSKACTLKGTIIVQARDGKEENWRTVASGTSDKAGNFTMPYPYGRYTSAVARVSLDQNSITTLGVDPESSNESISSDFIYIMLEGHSENGKRDGKKDDCNCNPMSAAGRLPSNDELLQSDQFTQDVGGACMNLSVPNRTLREYSYNALVRFSDPDVANYTMSSFELPMPGTDKFKQVVYRLQAKGGKVTRRPIDLDNPVQWQDITDNKADMSVYQAVTVATGHVLYYRSEVRADGYSLGDLLYSLPLAPGQKKQIVQIDSLHSLVGTENQSITQTEDLAAGIINDRAIVDQIAGNIGETLQGQSSASTAGISAATGGSGSMGAFGGSIGVAGGYSNSKSDASQSSGRNISQFFAEQLKQSIQQNASSYRHLNASVVTAVRENQRYSAETTTVANHNHCHSLTMMYFEVLRHFAVYQDLVDVEECVFVPLLMTRFSLENISKWADALAPRLLTLHSNIYLRAGSSLSPNRRHPLLPAFDAAERVRTEWKMVDYPDTTYHQEIIQWVQGEMSIMTEIPRPKTRYDFIVSLPMTTKTVTHKEYDIQTAVKDSVIHSVPVIGHLFGGDGTKTVSETVLIRAQIFDAFMTLDPNYENVPPARCIRINSFDPVPDNTIANYKAFDPVVDFLKNDTDDWKMWDAYAQILGHGSGEGGVRNLLTKYFLRQLIGDWDHIFNRGIAPLVYNHLVGSLKFDVGGTPDPTSLSTYRGGERLMKIAFANQASVKRANVSILHLVTTSGKAKTLKDTPVRFIVQNLRINYSTAHYNGLLFNGPVNGDLLDDTGVQCWTPVTAAEMRNPKDEDRFLCQRLITHLNQNIEYYNRVLWYSLDVQRRYLLLDGFHIETFDKHGAHEGFRSLSSVLKNSLIGVAGNSLVFPVAPGYKVNQSLIVASDDEECGSSESLLDHYRSDLLPPPYRMSVPTRGVYSEAMIGNCDSCEKVKPDSSQDWTKFTADEPTAIAAVAPPVPTISQYQASFKDFAPPMVSIQNAPAAPDPGIGLKAVTELLGKANIFQDITGLDANQQNAMQTYLSNQENAKSIAGMSSLANMASSMATQAHNTSNSSKIMDTIKSGLDSGTLTEAETSKLVKDHIQQQIDGGASKKAELEMQKSAANPSLTDVGLAAAQNDKSMEAYTTDPSGSSQYVSIGAKEGASSTSIRIIAEVKGTIPTLAQDPAKLTCWAVVVTMMVSWRKKQLVTTEDALYIAGDEWVDKFTTGEGLKVYEKEEFIKSMDMKEEGPDKFPPSSFAKFITKYGPLWITVDELTEEGLFSPHAKLLWKIEGDGDDSGKNTFFTFNDPFTGKTERQPFSEFLVSFQQMVTDKAEGAQLTPQVVHFAFPIDEEAPEGFKIGSIISEPVHEFVVIGALAHSTLKLDPRTMPGRDGPTNEVLHGVIWNDDPGCFLFDDDKNNNWDRSSGFCWLWNYKLGGRWFVSDIKNILVRSHDKDLQFLHSMASAVNEDPHDTLAKLRLWVEVMYKLSIGVIGPNDRLDSIMVETQFTPSKKYRLSSFFSSKTRPSGRESLYRLLTDNTSYLRLDMRRRALGSILHCVEDSYAYGHCKRKLLNPGDLIPGSTTKFRPGTYGKLDTILRFHTYGPNNSDKHGDYDKVPKNALDPSNIESYNVQWGLRDAVEQSVKIINFWAARTPWEQGPEQWFIGEVFKLDPAVLPADDNI